MEKVMARSQASVRLQMQAARAALQTCDVEESAATYISPSYAVQAVPAEGPELSVHCAVGTCCQCKCINLTPAQVSIGNQKTCS